jgi:hypothetical protein
MNEIFNWKNFKMFEEIIEQVCINTLMQNILNIEHIVDDNSKPIIMV